MLFRKESREKRVEVMEKNREAVNIAANQISPQLSTISIGDGRNRKDFSVPCKLTRKNFSTADCSLQFSFSFKERYPDAALLIKHGDEHIARFDLNLFHYPEEKELSSHPFVQVVSRWRRCGLGSVLAKQKDGIYQLYMDKFKEFFPDTEVYVGVEDKTTLRDFGWSSRRAGELGLKKERRRFYSLMLGSE